MPNNVYRKPFLKWVGGKTQIMNQVMDKIPTEMNNYHELFTGGGSVVIEVLSRKREGSIKIKGKVYAYDLNAPLIQTYKVIQSSQKDELLNHIEKHVKIYDSINGAEINRKPNTIEEAMTSKESYYYWLRSLYNSIDPSCIEKSALFILLNKLCFRGVYREGPNGFNVPFGHYKTTPVILTKEQLDYLHELFQDVEFICSDFRESVKNINIGDYVYIDPPYAPETKKSFVGYTADGFNMASHTELFQIIHDINKKGVKFSMSNAKVDFVLDNFKGYKCQDIVARRAINSKNPEAKTMEVIVYSDV